VKTVIVRFRKRYPRAIENKFKEVDSDFTAFISINTPNRPFQTVQSTGWRELRNDEDIFELAKTADVFYKTPGSSRKLRMYVSTDKDEPRFLF